MIGRRLGILLAEIAPLLGFLVAWEFVSRATGPALLPGPLRIFSVFWDSALSNEVIAAQNGGHWGFLPHVWASLWATVEGCALGGAAGLAAALDRKSVV